MASGVEDLFRPESWKPALESYSAATHLTVEVIGLGGERLLEPLSPTPVYTLLAVSPRQLGLFARCARRCLGQTSAEPRVVVEQQSGLAVAGTRLMLADRTVGAAVAGYVVTAFPDQRTAQRLALETDVSFADLWALLRRQLPRAQDRVMVYGELLHTLCDALMKENHRGRQLEAASARLAAESEAKDRFLAVLSHELRTPLTAMLGWARMLRTKKLGEPAAERAVEAIERSTKIQAQLIEDLLDVSRIVAGKVQLELRPVRLAPIIEAAVETLRPAADAKGIRLEYLPSAAAGLVAADPVRISQIVTNLVSNSIKFTSLSGVVEVRLSQSGHEVQLSVTDTGVGIAAELLPHVFERFRQSDSSATRPHGGLGLGLTIVRHLVELHGGRVKPASLGIGRGATFTVWLPALNGSDASLVDHLAADTERAQADDMPTLEGIRVLVVDDESDARELFKSILEQHKTTVETVGSVTEALKLLERWTPDVLVSDIGMANESGYDLIRTVRRLDLDERASIPALAVTAYAGPEDRRLALAAGFQLHLAKPVDPAVFARTVAYLAGRLKAA